MSRYTTSAIEVHLSSVEEILSTTDGLDVEASTARLDDVVTEALRTAYPQYDVSVYTGQSQFHSVEVEGFPDDVEPEDIKAVVDGAISNYDAWFVEAEAHAQ